ncbi:MAG: serine hydrolase [Parvibaculaceae bacterium]|nr:serine hydrolase [Parvibaculaceae bacterium]
MNVISKTMQPEDVGLSARRLDAITDFFKSYVDKGKLTGFSTLVSRHGQIAHQAEYGLRYAEENLPVESDTIYRIYSMTKPIVSLALMMLHDEGRFQISHPVSRYIPEFANLKVWAGGTAEDYQTKPCEREMTIVDLLTHTSGLTYGFMQAHPVDALYRKAGINGGFTDRLSLKETVLALAELPLLFSPGEKWSYSIATDVCGYLVEVLSGVPLDEFLNTRIFEPLGMIDTGFWVPGEQLHRLAANYERNPKSRTLRLIDKPDESSLYSKRRTYLSGGGGLVSTQADYWRFCQMVLNGGEFGGVRLISRKTIEFMAANHLPGNQTMKAMDDSAFSETRPEGSGFGLGFSVLLDPVEAQLPGSSGAISWGGAASTYFWIDPEEDLIAIMMTQLMPSGAYPLRPQFQQLVYAALED